MIFPLIGFFVVLNRIKKGFKAGKLLRHGRIGLGKLKSKIPTNTRINEQRVYELAFEFNPDEGETYEMVTRTHLVGL